MNRAYVDFFANCTQLQQTIKDRYAGFELPYNGTDNDDYVNGGGFCCDDHPKLRAGAIGNGNDNPEIYQYYYHSDHLGSTSLITDLDGDMVQHVEYVPFGEVFIEERNNKWNTPYLFNAKELDEETGLYYYGVRYYDPRVSVWLGADPLQEKYPNVSSYAYAFNNPVKFVDTEGEAWRPTYDEDNDGNRTYNGYEWIPEDQSYDSDGNLLSGLYAQAIFFSDNGTFDASSRYNMGSSTATVYLVDGTTTTFDANTHPSDASKYATTPEGLYEAYVGTHNGSKSSYTALKMRDVGALSNTIELGKPNPSDPSRTYAQGIDIHKPGANNLTGMGSDGSPMSTGCLLIDINKWGRFIGNFNNASQKNNPISVTVSRTFVAPVNATRLPAFNFFMNGTWRSFFGSFLNNK